MQIMKFVWRWRLRGTATICVLIILAVWWLYSELIWYMLVELTCTNRNTGWDSILVSFDWTWFDHHAHCKTKTMKISLHLTCSMIWLRCDHNYSLLSTTVAPRRAACMCACESVFNTHDFILSYPFIFFILLLHFHLILSLWSLSAYKVRYFTHHADIIVALNGKEKVHVVFWWYFFLTF